MKVTQHLWFEKDMEAAIGFHTSLIQGSAVGWVSPLFDVEGLDAAAKG